tara:strand:- start:88 stop:948 length:861 start_codon:yes stop_codon:yes gene_type:complete
MLRVTVAYHRSDADELTLSNLRNVDVDVELVNGASLPTQMELRASLASEDMKPTEGLMGGAATLIYHGRARMKLRVAPSSLSSRDGRRFRLRLDVPEHPSLTAHSPAFKVVTKLAPGEGARHSFESCAALVVEATVQDEATSGVRPPALALAEPEQSSDVQAEVPTGLPDKLTRGSLSDLIDRFSWSANAVDEPRGPPTSLSASQAKSSLLGELLKEALEEDSTALLDDDTSGGLRNHFTLEELEAEAIGPAAVEEQPRKSKEHAERCEDISEGRRHEARRHRVSA